MSNEYNKAHHEAMFWESSKNTNGSVQCLLCHHNCIISDGHYGFCGTRANFSSVLYAESYGVISGFALDPIEKKPLRHFYPGSSIFSIGSLGCNFRCSFCQNHTISIPFEQCGGWDLSSSDLLEISPVPRRVTPDEITALALKYIPDGNIGIAYTYNEPTIGYEFVLDCSRLAHEISAGRLKNVLVTNGCIKKEPFLALLPHIDALNIDLKSFNPTFYKKIRGDISLVKENIAAAASQAHVEITTLVIPGENDSLEEIDSLAAFLAEIDNNIPLHLSRFSPRYKMTDKAQTPKDTMRRLHETAAKRLKFVYLGNMW